MALMRTMAALLLLVIAFGAAAGGIELREFDDPVMEKRYHDLTASMRCPLCENQAINDSDAPISADMRISKLSTTWCSDLVNIFSTIRV